MSEQPQGPGIALQLWTVRELVERDMLATLQQVAELGYRAVEFAGLGEANAAQVRHTLDALGLQAISAHVPLDDLTAKLPHVIEQMHTLGCRQVVLPYIPPSERTSIERVQHLAEHLNAIGQALAAAGITFAYHNEDYDFLPLDESTLWHTLVAQTDPSLVKLQLDLFTATAMQADPLALMQTYGPRITSLHLCDARDGRYVPIGTGTFDWPAILNAAHITAAKWLIVEQDGSPQPLADAATNLHNLHGLMRQAR